MNEQKDPRLWKLAKARAEFKTHVTVYTIVMAVLWLIWLFTGGVNAYPWPIWPTMGWGIGVLFNYFGAFKFDNAAEREYEKLKGETTPTETRMETH
jgi:hypothetical protein